MRSTVKILWIITLSIAAVAIALQLVTFQPASLVVTVQEYPLPDTNTPRPYHYSDNDKYQEQTNFFSLFATGKANIVMLGDSHTYRMFWNELLHRCDVVNRGIGSDISDGYLHRMGDVFAVHPRICFLQGGGNDIGHHVPRDTIIRNYRQIISQLKQHHIEPVLTALFLAGKSFRWSDSIAYNDQVKQLNKQLFQLSKAEGIAYIDINPIVSKDGYLQDIFVQPDGVHLNAAAYLIWKKEIEVILANRRL